MSSRRRTRLNGGQDASMCQDWGHLFHSILDRVKAKMAEHEVAVLLQCGRLVNRHWCRWATGATTHLELATRQHLDEELKGVVKAFFGLEDIVLEGVYYADLLPLLQAPQLKCLEIEGCFHFAVLGLFTNLVSLKLGTIATFNMSGDECMAILARLPALMELGIQCHLSDVGIKDLGAMSRLVKCALLLDVGTIRNVKLWKGLGAMTNLLGLEVGSISMDIPSGLLGHLSTLTKLNNLGLDQRMSHAEWQPLTCLNALSGLRCALEHQSMEGCLKSFQQSHRLSSLDVSCSGQVSGAKWIGALTGLVDLRYNGSPDDIHCLGSLTAMTSLTLESTYQVTDAHLTFLSTLTALKKLSLGESLTVWRAIASSLPVLVHLTDMELCDCQLLTDSMVEDFSTLSALTKLVLDDCLSITDAGMAKLASLTELAVLELDGCVNITDAGVLQLAPLRYLRRLDLVCCPRVKIDIAAFLRKWN